MKTAYGNKTAGIYIHEERMYCLRCNAAIYHTFDAKMREFGIGWMPTCRCHLAVKPTFSLVEAESISLIAHHISRSQLVCFPFYKERYGSQ